MKTLKHNNLRKLHRLPVKTKDTNNSIISPQLNRLLYLAKILNRPLAN